jgi:hypothetical protein
VGGSPPARGITGFHRDDQLDWVAELHCGHYQHVRHNPPWQERPWAATPEARESSLGRELYCKKCVEGAPADGPGRAD